MEKKLDKMINIPCFRRMVESTNLMHDLSNGSSLLSQSDLLQRSALAGSFEKIMPSHSQIKEDEHPEQLPCFG